MVTMIDCKWEDVHDENEMYYKAGIHAYTVNRSSLSNLHIIHTKIVYCSVIHESEKMKDMFVFNNMSIYTLSLISYN